MGRHDDSQPKVAMTMTDSDDEESNKVINPWLEDLKLNQDEMLDNALDALLYEERGSAREKTLLFIMKPYINDNMKKRRNKLMEKKFVNTLLHQCLLSIKKGSKKESSKEINLASRIIGLLALTVGFGDDAREIYEKCICTLEESLTSGLYTPSTSFLVRCLAVVTFVGVNNDQEKTQKSMDIMWRLIKPSSNNVDSLVKPSPSLITNVVSSWSFLLSTMGNLALNPITWQNPITYLSSFLDKQDRSQRIVAGEALALIFEVGLIDESYEAIFHQLKDRVVNQVRKLTAEAGVKSCNRKDLKRQRNLFKGISSFFEFGFCPEITTKIGGRGGTMRTSSWSKMIQLNFFKQFLGGGFINHMKGNELLHHVFDYIPKKRNIENKLIKSNNKENSRILNKQRKKRQESFYLNAILGL